MADDKLDMRAKVEDLARRRELGRSMGGEKRIARQHGRGKMDVRQRIDRLFDAGTFEEIGVLATHHVAGDPVAEGKANADGVVCGTGRIDGRLACVAAYDFTVMGGSIGPTGEVKVSRMRELALRGRMPMIWLIDSGGARIPNDPRDMNKISWFADSGYLFREQVVMSGVIPQVAAMVGPGAAGTAYIPALADFVPMVKGTSSMALGGPALVKAVTGKEISEEELGGARMHNEVSGVADALCKNDEVCIDAVKEYLSFFPSHCGEKPPIRSAEPVPPSEGANEALLDILPENPRATYDMKKLVKLITDGGELFEMKARWAKNILTGFARFDGRPAGIVANNPRHWGGILDVDGADKAARFVNLCNSFNIPLIFLVDVPGFMVGQKTEQAGIIRHGAKMLFEVSNATVPKITCVVRKAYGAGYYVMCGRAYEPDVIVGWPTAEVGLMGPEGMVGIAMMKQLQAVIDNHPDGPEAGAAAAEAMKKAAADAIRPHIDPVRVAGHGFLDEVIDPRETRATIIRGLEMTENKVVERPWRRGGVRPI
jgi:acetyl-CoA carboxylase carboxyltransferase component